MSKFVEHIKDGMSMFGMDLVSESSIGELRELVFKDRTHGTGYIALAKQTSSTKPAEHWGKVIDGPLTELIMSTAHGNRALPAALIVPSGEAEAVYAEALNRGTRPSTYQLFDNFVVLGFSNRDTSYILENKRKADEAEETAKPKEQPNQVAEQTLSKEIKPPIEKEVPQVKNKRSLDPKKIAAAALLGVSIASIPFAINKLSDNDAYGAPPVVEEVLESAIEGRPEIAEIQSAIASNPSLSPHAVEHLLDNGYKMEAAGNPNIPQNRFRELVYSSDPRVRVAVARNPNLPLDFMKQLANDHEPSVRAAVASNPSLPNVLMDTLSRDSNSIVRSGVLSNPNLTPQILNTIYPDISMANCEDREKIYASDCVSKDMMIEGARANDQCIRRGVARNPSAPSELVNGLAKDVDKSVRMNALANGALPPEATGVFDSGWNDKSTPDAVSDIHSALTNPSISEETVNIAALNPAKYGVPLAQNPAIGVGRVEKIYSYSKPKGGMGGLFDELAEIPADEEFIQQLNNQRIHSQSPERDPWQDSLRSTVNGKFRDNVFDPLSLAQDIITDSAGSPSLDSLPSLSDNTEGGEFFDNPVPNVSLADTPESFEEFFSDLEIKDPKAKEKINTIARVADNIVDEIMEEMAPAVERAMDSFPVKGRGDEIQANTSPNDDTPPIFTDDNLMGSKEPDRQALGEQTGENQPVFPTPASVRAAEAGMYNNVLSDKLYERSCRQVEDLIKLF